MADYFNFTYDKDALTKFVEGILKKHNIYNVDAKDMADMIIEAITAEVMKIKQGNTRQLTFGIDDGQLEAAICQAHPYVKEWKASKKKAEAKEYKEKAKANVGTPSPTGKKVLRKPKKEEEDEFDIEQLELF